MIHAGLELPIQTAPDLDLTQSAQPLFYLALAVNALSSMLAILTLVSYLILYTPLKRKTPLCTLYNPTGKPPDPTISGDTTKTFNDYVVACFRKSRSYLILTAAIALATCPIFFPAPFPGHHSQAGEVKRCRRNFSATVKYSAQGFLQHLIGLHRTARRKKIAV